MFLVIVKAVDELSKRKACELASVIIGNVGDVNCELNPLSAADSFVSAVTKKGLNK